MVFLRILVMIFHQKFFVNISIQTLFSSQIHVMAIGLPSLPKEVEKFRPPWAVYLTVHHFQSVPTLNEHEASYSWGVQR